MPATDNSSKKLKSSEIYSIADGLDSVALSQDNASLMKQLHAIKEQLQATKESNASLETKLECANLRVADLKQDGNYSKYHLNRTMVEVESLRNQLGKSKAELEAVKLNCSDFKAQADAADATAKAGDQDHKIQIEKLNGQRDTARANAQACKIKAES